MARRREPNICTLTDSYKEGHWDMIPEDTEYVNIYYESRIGAKFNNTVFNGLQPLMMKYLEGPVVTMDKVDYAKWFVDQHIPIPGVFNYEGWKHIVKEYDGHLPLIIKAVPEGTPIPTGNAMMTIQNTDNKVPWLPTFVDPLLMHVWGPSAVASLSREIKIMCKQYLKWTADSYDALPYMLNDFGFRACRGPESSGFLGVGHILNFDGTDTQQA
ncbi:MAG: nicotinate phosphoribosyltransferase, partial [bacterium]|nr:nicotinate phosphoribosyltransferase [bacterium]